MNATARCVAWLLLAGQALLAGCGALPIAGADTALEGLTRGRVQGQAETASILPAERSAAIARLLAQPLDIDAAVQVALLNSPGLELSLARLGIREAEQARAALMPNPHLALGRFAEGDAREVERMLRFNLMDLLTLAWRQRWAGQQVELARLEAAQDVLRLAADTRKAWVRAVAARQSAQYQRDVMDATEAGAELARRLARVGNWSRLNQARQQSLLADATAQLARAEHQALASREQLTRLLGLWGEQAGYRLPERLPELPAAARDLSDVEAQAIGQRLDVRSAVREAAFMADSLGLVRVSDVVDSLELGVVRSTTWDRAAGTRETRRGAEIELPLPLFDAGQARSTRAQALYAQAQARVRDTGVRARSEAREAYHAYRTAHDLARHYRDEVVPLRRFISDEMLLRYNGMLGSVFDLLADTRAHVLAVNASLEAQRDFWLADTDLHITLTGTSPAGLSALQGTSAAIESTPGH